MVVLGRVVVLSLVLLKVLGLNPRVWVASSYSPKNEMQEYTLDTYRNVHTHEMAP